jgi:hypothetical protein
MDNEKISLAPIPTPTVQMYNTSLLTELWEWHQTLSLAHLQLQQKHQVELATHDQNRAHYQHEE